jgi:hypothetical protein
LVVRHVHGALDDGDVRRLHALQHDVLLGDGARTLILLWGCTVPAEPSCQAFDFSGGRRISWCNRRKPVAQRIRTGLLFTLRCFGSSAFGRVASNWQRFFSRKSS